MYVCVYVCVRVCACMSVSHRGSRDDPSESFPAVTVVCTEVAVRLVFTVRCSLLNFDL